MLIQLRAQTAIEQILPLLLHPEADFILMTAFNITSIISNTQNINLAVTRISKIVFSLKSLTFNSHGEWSDSDLREGIETVLTLYQNQIKNGIELIRDYQPIQPLSCLPDELNQVWTNLIHNALQAMNYQGTLSIGIRTVDNCAQISIRDSGKGMSEEVQQKFSMHFYDQADGRR